LAAVLLVASVIGYDFYGRTSGNIQTSTLSSYSIGIQPLNSTRSATAGSTVLFMFNVTSPMVGPLYFYASAVPPPGSHWQMNLQNVTTEDIALPSGVQVSYPTGQAVFGTSHATLVLKITFSPSLDGTVGLVVGAFQQVNEQQTVGHGSAFYITVSHTVTVRIR